MTARAAPRPTPPSAGVGVVLIMYETAVWGGFPLDDGLDVGGEALDPAVDRALRREAAEVDPAEETNRPLRTVIGSGRPVGGTCTIGRRPADRCERRVPRPHNTPPR